jgi:hypothetical protein
MIAHRYNGAMAEFETAPVESFKLSAIRSLLQVRGHRRRGRLLEDLVARQREYGAEADPFDFWDAHIAGRDLAGAAAFLMPCKRLNLAPMPRGFWAFPISAPPGSSPSD